MLNVALESHLLAKKLFYTSVFTEVVKTCKGFKYIVHSNINRQVTAFEILTIIWQGRLSGHISFN